MKKQKQFKYRSMKIQYHSVLQNRTDRVYLFTSSTVAAGISLFKTKGDEEEKNEVILWQHSCLELTVQTYQWRELPQASFYIYIFIYVCRNKCFVMTKICFVTTSILLLRHKTCFVVTKIILVAAPTNDKNQHFIWPTIWPSDTQ